MHRKSLIRFTTIVVAVTCLLPVTVLAHPAADSTPGLALFARLEAVWTAVWQGAWNRAAAYWAKDGGHCDPDGQPQCASHAVAGPSGRPRRPGSTSDAPPRRVSGGGQGAATIRPGS